MAHQQSQQHHHGSIGIHCCGVGSSCLPGTPGNPTEVEGVATVIVVVKASTHTVTGGVLL